jgi:flavodoxin
MKKVLVAYYSRTGYTSAVAREIARACNADLESIRDIRGHGTGVGYLRSAFEAALHTSTNNRRVKNAPEEYELVIIGTPIWCWNISSPIRAYLETQREHFKRVAFFCTYGGSGKDKVLREMATLAGKPAVANMGVSDNEINQGAHHDKISSFISRLGGTSSVPPLRSVTPVAAAK